MPFKSHFSGSQSHMAPMDWLKLVVLTRSLWESFLKCSPDSLYTNGTYFYFSLLMYDRHLWKLWTWQHQGFLFLIYSLRLKVGSPFSTWLLLDAFLKTLSPMTPAQHTGSSGPQREQKPWLLIIIDLSRVSYFAILSCLLLYYPFQVMGSCQ